MKRTRWISLPLALALLCPLPAAAAEGEEPLWTRTEPGGAYVTVRVPCPEGEELAWGDQQDLAVRYADTGEAVPLTSEYHEGWIFATVPAADADRPLEAFRVEPTKYADCYASWLEEKTPVGFYDAPLGVSALDRRGIVRGDDAGNLNGDASLTRAEAFTLIARLLSLKPAGDPGYADVEPGDWYYDAVSACRAAGIAAEDVNFNPTRPVTRGEMAVMLYWAMHAVGWVDQPEGTAADLPYVDAASIPGWALDAYLALETANATISTTREGSELDSDGLPKAEFLAEQDKPATRAEAFLGIWNALRRLPWYPTQTAIDWGFDREMPVIDGSTSTLPYTRAVYGTLFYNADSHPQYPAGHSKSYYSYDRMINGEADVLFISTKPTEDTLAKAQAAGVELELTPIAYDAMVFFTNGDNTIEGLTSEQIREIYVNNTVTNWSELGGPDAAFVPYCRNMDSGSQAQMEEFFLHGDEIHPDIARETTSRSMESIFTDVWKARKDDPLTYALGYSIYYYYYGNVMTLLPSEDTIKMLAVDGVLPTDETIADGSYPLAGYNYAVVRTDAPEDSLGRRMVEFMGSDVGQLCVLSAGFGPLDPSVGNLW